MQRVLVLSDLHLGGAPGVGAAGLRMCSPSSQARLARFFRWAASGASSRKTTLVVAGDIVDFLAERPFAPFSIDEEGGDACRKLEQIFKTTDEVWDALRDCLRAGIRLVLMAGNHDLEMSLPGPRRLLLDRLGPGSVELVYDNQAFVVGRTILVEHGNRYDPWNAVWHDELRAVRSAVSRREPTPREWQPPPGSELVASVLNELKARHAFVDLLKPETSAVLPILAVLEPSKIKELLRTYDSYRLYWRARGVRYRKDGQPIDRRQIGAPPSADDEKPLIDLACELAGYDARAIGALRNAGALLDLWRASQTPADRRLQIDRLYRALRAWAHAQRRTFDLGWEDEKYLRPAWELASRGFRFVIFGHTHLAKRVVHPESGAVYLNAGTWADLMRIPAAVVDDEAAIQASGDGSKERDAGKREAAAKNELERFIDDLDSNRLGEWREQVPTFVQIDEAETPRAELMLFRDDRAEPIQEGDAAEHQDSSTPRVQLPRGFPCPPKTTT